MFAPTKAKTPKEYIDSLEEPRKSEIKKIDAFIQKHVKNSKPYIESGMIGYLKTHFKYSTSRELDWPLISLASRKGYISIYVCAADGKQYLPEKYKDKLKASIGKSCIRFKKVEDIDWKMLKNILLEAQQMLPSL